MTPEIAQRAVVAVLAVIALALGLIRLRLVPRDLGLTGFAVAAAVLGIYAVFGTQAAAVGAGVILVVFAIGGAIYGVLAVVARLAER